MEISAPANVSRSLLGKLNEGGIVKRVWNNFNTCCSSLNKKRKFIPHRCTEGDAQKTVDIHDYYRCAKGGVEEIMRL